MSKDWIAGAVGNKGALHRNLGVPEGQKLSLADIARGKKMGGKVAKEAALATTLRKIAERNRG